MMDLHASHCNTHYGECLNAVRTLGSFYLWVDFNMVVERTETLEGTCAMLAMSPL